MSTTKATFTNRNKVATQDVVREPGTPVAGSATPVSRTTGARQLTGAAARALAVLRIAFGITFLWAFLDKLIGLGFHTGAIVDADTGARTGIDVMGPDAWLQGGSPTEGFLSFGVPAHNPFKDVFANLAGQAWVDWLFMAGLLGIGVALLLGIGMRLAGICGALLYAMMYAASLPLDNNPIVDDHLTGAITVVVLALTLAGDTWGLGRWWTRTNLVERFPVLR